MKFFVDTADLDEIREAADMGILDGIGFNEEIRRIYDNYEGLETEILAASIRHPTPMKRSALAGADVATMPFSTLETLLDHPLTDQGLERFLADWEGCQETRSERTAA